MTSNKRNKPVRQKMPEQVRIAMYDVGFGDCFLLSFSYADGEARRVLIDCGSTSENKKHMSQVVNILVDDCEGHIEAIVATHRHRDHISAFGLKGLGEKLEKLNPEIVIQPWTEHPDAEEAAIEAPSVFTAGAVRHLRSLDAAQEFAEHLINRPNNILSAAGPRTRSRVVRLASLSIPNKKAIERLTRMGKKHAYVHSGSQSGLERLLPGVQVSVLGPPTLTQTQSIRKQTQWDEDEFWKLFARVAAISASNIATARGRSDLFPKARTDTIAKSPSYVKWLIKRLDRAQLHNVQRIVRALDRALNNTSVILLFKIGDKMLLFPGDAQLENWQYALKDRKLKRRLSKVLLYKVGHHGSTNATPKSLWNLFARRSANDGRLISLLSTKRGHHSEVPRTSLVKALESETVLHSTQGWRRKLREEYTPIE